jgi:hypothetical protein
MFNIVIHSATSVRRFGETDQAQRLRETRLQAWWLERILEDRADCCGMPPLELIEAAGHG